MLQRDALQRTLKIGHPCRQVRQRPRRSTRASESSREQQTIALQASVWGMTMCKAGGLKTARITPRRATQSGQQRTSGCYLPRIDVDAEMSGHPRHVVRARNAASHAPSCKGARSPVRQHDGRRAAALALKVEQVDDEAASQ